MPAPTNISAATAVELGPLPNSIAQQVDDAGTTYTVWYKISNTVAGMIGPWAFGDLVTYRPSLQIFESDGVTRVVGNNLGSSPNKRMQFPSVASTTYYLKIIPNAGNPSPANLTISALYFTVLDPTPVAGSVLTNDDTDGMPALVMDAAGVPRTFLYDMANGESGSILPNGRFLLTRDDETGADNGTATIYEADGLTEVATFTINADTGNSLLLPSGASNTYFYVLDTNLAPYILQQVDDDGVVISNVWHLGFAVKAIAPSRDDTILYYASSAATGVIKRWDLVNNIALADLYTLPAGFAVAFQALLVLSDGSIVIGANHAAATVSHKVFRIDNTGALLNTYDLTYATFVLNRIALNTGDTADSLWVWSRSASTGVSRYEEVSTVGTGSIISTFDITEYESGVYNGVATATPTLEFGPSLSCPFLILRAAEVAIETEPIRRLRQFTIPGAENFWIFLQKLEFEFQRGQGLIEGQGSDPQIMFQLSRDGGKTWEPERWVSAGKLGEYQKRAIFRKLGRARNPVGRVIVSDPVFWAFQDAYIEAIQGTS